MRGSDSCLRGKDGGDGREGRGLWRLPDNTNLVFDQVLTDPPQLLNLDQLELGGFCKLNPCLFAGVGKSGGAKLNAMPTPVAVIFDELEGEFYEIVRTDPFAVTCRVDQEHGLLFWLGLRHTVVSFLRRTGTSCDVPGR